MIYLELNDAKKADFEQFFKDNVKSWTLRRRLEKKLEKNIKQNKVSSFEESAKKMIRNRFKRVKFFRYVLLVATFGLLKAWKGCNDFLATETKADALIESFNDRSAEVIVGNIKATFDLTVPAVNNGYRAQISKDMRVMKKDPLQNHRYQSLKSAFLKSCQVAKGIIGKMVCMARATQKFCQHELLKLKLIFAQKHQWMHIKELLELKT